MSKLKQFREMAAVALGNKSDSAADIATAVRITNNTLTQTGAVLETALESMGNAPTLVPTGHQPPQMKSLANELKQFYKGADRFVPQVLETLLMNCDGAYHTGAMKHTDPSQIDPSVNIQSMESMMGHVAASAFRSENLHLDILGTESIGSTIDKAIDPRLGGTLAILRPRANAMDKMFARVNEENDTFRIVVPIPEIYDWAKTQAANSTAASRYADNTTRFRDLQLNPSMLDTTPKRIVPVPSQDTDSVLYTADKRYFKVGGNQIQLKQLALDTATVGYDKDDLSDTIAEGGLVTNLLIEVSASVGGVTKTEVFKFTTSHIQGAGYAVPPAADRSGQRLAMFSVTPVLTAARQKYTATDTEVASEIAAALTEASVALKVTNFTSTVDLSFGILTGSAGAVTPVLQAKPGVTPGATTNALFASLTAKVIAFTTDLSWNEENMRKATTAIRMNRAHMQFTVPMGKVFMVESTLAQELDKDSIEVLSTAMAQGNDIRGLTILTTQLGSVTTANQEATLYPETALFNRLDNNSLASGQVYSMARTGSIDFADHDYNLMNESTRLAEAAAVVRNRIEMLCSSLLTDSLMGLQYDGEAPVFKAIAHSTLVDLILSVNNYTDIGGQVSTNKDGADVSIDFGGKFRLDIVRSSINSMKGKLFAFPVIASKMEDILSAATIRDCGQLSVNYVNQPGGAAVRRYAAMSREVVLFQNRMGVALNVLNYGTITTNGTAVSALTPIALGSATNSAPTV